MDEEKSIIIHLPADISEEDVYMLAREVSKFLNDNYPSLVKGKQNLN